MSGVSGFGFQSRSDFTKVAVAFKPSLAHQSASLVSGLKSRHSIAQGKALGLDAT